MRLFWVFAFATVATVAVAVTTVADEAVVAPASVPTTKDQIAFATSDATDFSKMAAPRVGDWLDRFNEPGQSFLRYVRSRPVRARGERRVFAFLPVGPFDGQQRKLAERTAAFSRLWFALEVKVLPARPLPENGWRREHLGNTQYRTAYFLDHLLPDNLPKDAVCLFGVTMADLYPQEDWNFVFGHAHLRRRVGVWSFHRFVEGAMPPQILRRACRLVVHEAGHAFGLEHCIRYLCTMNGANSLAESDAQPLRLCPPCLKKLTWNRGFDVLDRYRKLRAFCREHELGDEAKWFARRIARVSRRGPASATGPR